MKLAKAEALYYPNLVINGDFNIWPRGESFNTNFAYTAAMWQMSSNTATVSKNPTGGMKIDISSAACILMQYLKVDYTGKTLTFQMKINGSTEYAYTYDSVQSGSSSVQLANGISLNISYSSEKQATQLWIRFDSAYISSIVIDWIDVKPLPYATVHIEEDEAIALMRSQEWVYRIPNALIGYGGGSGNLWFSVPHLLNMKGVPSISTSSSANIVCEGRITSVSNITLQFNSTYKTLQSSNYEGQNSFISKVVGLYFAEDIIFSCEP